MGKLGGRKSKDSVISDGFNSTKIYTKPGRPRKHPSSPANISSESPTAQLASTLGITAADIDNWGEEIFDPKVRIQPSTPLEPIEDTPTSGYSEPFSPTEQTREEAQSVNIITTTSTPPAGKADSGADSGEDSFAEDLMADMRYVYKQLGGRAKLRDLMAGDKEFIGLVKELMKVEAAYLAKKLSMKNEGQVQGFFVVLKGLEGDDKLVKDMQNNKAIDFKQIERAMNPTLERSRVENEIKLGLRPDEIMRKVHEVKD